MNQPCIKCGRIITIPDIPLPAGYTQKCTACGFANDVGESDLDTLTPPSVGGLPDESWNASFDSTMDFPDPMTDSANHAAAAATDDRFRELESRLRAELDRRLAAHSGSQTQVVEPAAGLAHHMVVPGDVLICTQNTAIYQKCFQVLSELDYRIEGVGDTTKAYGLLAARHFQIVIVDQQFLNTGDAGRRVFQHLKDTPVDIRRAQTVVLLTPGIATMESQVFYQWSMDLNVHPRDMDRLGVLVRQTVAHKASILTPLLLAENGD